MMKTKMFVGLFAFLTLVLATSFVSAATLELTESTLTPFPDSTNPGVDVTINFQLEHTGESPNNQQDLNWSQSTVSCTTGTCTFKQLPTLASINVGEVKQLSAIITVSGTASGNVDFTISVESESNAMASITDSMTINNAPSLAITKIQELTKTQNGLIEVMNNGNVQINNIQLTDTGAFDVTFNPSGTFNLAPGATSQTISVSAPSIGNLKFGSNTATVTAKGKDTSNADVTATTQFNIQGSFCIAGPVGGNLVISDVKIDNQGEGSDDEWQLLDTIEIEVQVDNDGNDDIDDVFIEMGLFNSNGNNQVNDLDFEHTDEEERDVGRIRDGKDETVTFIFRVPADMEDGSYKLAIKAYSDDLGEDMECVDFSNDLSDDTFEDISIDRETDAGRFIAFEDIVLTPTQATCGDPVSLTMNVYNIGDEDQDQVRVNLFNSAMNLNQMFEIRNDLDQGDRQRVTFEFAVPQGLQDGGYQLRLSADYDYRSGSYRESSEEDTVFLLNVLGCGISPPPSDGNRIATINAQLDSDANAGEELRVQATITSLKSERATFIISSDNYQSWASITDISEQIVDLNSGESVNVVFTFAVDPDTEGKQSFDIEVVSNGVVETREVVVDIKPVTSGPSFNLGDNAYLWIIGIINVILIILIIIVAVRISRR